VQVCRTRCRERFSRRVRWSDRLFILCLWKAFVCASR
jgi:hypothetical protein